MKRPILITAGVVLVVLFIFGVTQFLKVQKAHSSFENYYAFRGCTKLLKKADDYAICTTDKGDNIKIVKVNNKWYLDGDLPVCYFKFCL